MIRIILILFLLMANSWAVTVKIISELPVTQDASGALVPLERSGGNYHIDLGKTISDSLATDDLQRVTEAGNTTSRWIQADSGFVGKHFNDTGSIVQLDSIETEKVVAAVLEAISMVTEQLTVLYDVTIGGWLTADKFTVVQDVKIALVSTADEILTITAGTPQSPGAQIDTVPGVPQRNVSYIGDIVFDPSLDSQIVKCDFSLSVSSGTSNTYTYGFAEINGVASPQRVERKIANQDDVGALSYHVVAPITGGDTLGFNIDILAGTNVEITIKQGASWQCETWDYIE